MHKIFKIILGIIAFILLLVAGVLFYLNTPTGQNFVRSEAENYLNKKLKTEVRIGHFGLAFPKYIVLDNVLLKDQAKDTLLSVNSLKVDVAMMALFHKQLVVQDVLLSGVHGHIYRTMPDTTFNFSYIITAFTGNKPATPKPATTKKKTSSSSSFSIDLDRVKLDDIHFRLDDETGGVALALNLEHLDLHMKNMNLDSMLFHIKDLAVSGMQATFKQDSSYLPLHPQDTTKTQLQLIADNVHLDQVNFNYGDRLNHLLFGVQLGDLVLQLKKFDLLQNRVDIRKLAINNTTSVLTLTKESRTPGVIDTIIRKDTTEGWYVTANDLSMNGVAFKMDNDNSPPQKTGIDYSHLELMNLGLQLNNLVYTSDSITGLFRHLAVTDKSGVTVEELKTAFRYSDTGVVLHDLYVQTPHTVLRRSIEVGWPSLDELAKHPEKLWLKTDIINSIVGIQDALLFVPQLNDQYAIKRNQKAQVRIDATINGRLDNLYAKRLYLLFLNGTEVDLNGRLSGLPDANKLSYNLHINKLRSKRTAMVDFVPDSLLQSVRLPDQFAVTGNVAGTMQDYNTDLTLVSTDGNAYVKGFFYMSPGKGKERYDMLVQTNKLNVGRILKQDSVLGAVSAAVTAKGTGLDMQKMSTNINGAIGSAFAEKYNYHDILFSVHLDHARGSYSLSAADSNLRVIVNGTADLSGKYAAVKADVQLDSIDLRALKLYSSEFRASGTMHIDFPVLNPDYPQGTFQWVKPVIAANGQRFLADSMFIASLPDAAGQHITADLDVITAKITGKTPLTKLGAIITERINRNYNIKGSDSAVVAGTQPTTKNTKDTKAKDTGTVPADYNLSFTAKVEDKPLLRGLLPGLTSFSDISINGSLTPRTLTVYAAIPEVVYGSNTIENGSVKVNGSDSALTYQVNADKIANSIIDLWYADVHGNFNQGAITTSISLSDSLRQERFALSANMLTSGDSQVIVLDTGLKLNYNKWDVATPNRIVYGKNGIYINNFSISYAGQYIKANSQGAAANAPVKVDITNFQLSNITAAISAGDTLLANGVLGAVLTLQNSNSGLQATGDLEVLGLAVMGDTLGNLQATVNLKDANSLNTKLSLTGNGNDIGINGTYYMNTTSGNDFDMQLDMKALSMHSFEGMAMKQLKNSSGFVRGNLHLTGTTSAPLATGSLKTDNLYTNVVMINSLFKMPAESMTFAGSTITFNNFTILDSPSNKAVVKGTVDIADLFNPALNLSISADKWRAIHSTEKDNKEFYGDLIVTAKLNLKGTAMAPIASGNINVLKGTNLTVVTPENQPQVESSKGIVAFVNMKDTGRARVLAARKKVPAKAKKATGADVNVNITVDKNAKFSLIIDKASGDFISVQGDANLNASISKTGTIGLNGNYELHQGAYQLNYNFIKRKFLIKDGSNISFAGDPVTGTTVDLTAVYEAVAPPYDLVERQVPDQSQLNYYKQNLPFDVDLIMKGKVLQPALTFNIDLPENKVYPLTADQIELIQGKLNQVRADTSELNRQVFALLILSRFVSDDPFISQGSSSFGFTALQSASTFIGEQLNKAAGKFVKGVDFSVDLATTEDYTTGDMRQRTDLNLAASKQLLNDRLKLTIGNDFELEGQQNTNQQTSYIPTNLAADYLLSADGRYTVRGYRRAYDEGVLQGYITETGLDFIVSLDYNHFKNVLKRRKNNDGKTIKDTIATK